MGATGITVVLAMYYLTGVVEAASLPPDDQYSPQQPPYRRDIAQGPMGYPNWLKYQQDLTTRLEPPDYTRRTRPDFSRDRIATKNLIIRDLDILPLDAEQWKFDDSPDVMRNSSVTTVQNLGVSKNIIKVTDSHDDDFDGDDTFQDQGPGSVEVYKLDLHRENSLLLPHSNKKHTITGGSRLKSKIPKKAIAEEILWKIKPIETSKTPLSSIFRKSSIHHHKDRTLSRESSRKIKDSHKDEVFAVGGVPELQVGCEGLEAASERDKRSSGPGMENKYNDNVWENSPNYQNPVYRESTEPILLRVTPIVLDIEEEEPPSGEVYEEMDELLKLKKLESTSPKSTTRRWNRADIDPALEIDKHREERTRIKMFPERGDLGPKSGNVSSSIEVKESITQEEPNRGSLENGRFRRDTDVVDSPLVLDTDEKDDKDLSRSSLSRIPSLNHQTGRRLLWVQYPEKQEYENRDKSARHHRDVNENPDLWGFGENDGELSEIKDETDIDKLRREEMEKRRREYERRKQEELYRRHGAAGHGHQSNYNESRDVNREIERIREEYERKLAKERRERQRISEERSPRREGKMDETRRRQEEESRRRTYEEQRRKEWNRRREEEEENRRRFENQRNPIEPPSSLRRTESPNNENISKSQHEGDDEERKLRDYIERNRPIDPKKIVNHRRPNEQSDRTENDERRRYNDEQQKRRRMEEERRRKTMEEHRRRQQQHYENERRRQMEENRRSHPQNRTTEEETKRRREEEEERKLRDYVRRNQPVIVPRRNNSQEASNWSREADLQEQRRTIEAARQWERNREPKRTNDGRIHGPSAPTNIGGQRHGQMDLEEMRRRQEIIEEERRRETHRRRLLEEEEHRRALEYQRVESRRHEEERKRLEATARREEETRRSEGRRNSWQIYGSSRRPTGEVVDREAEELRRRGTVSGTMGNSMRNREDEWRRRSEEREREKQQHEERERQRLENDRNSRNNGHRVAQHENSWPKSNQRGESVRSGHDETEWRRREQARLNSLPVSARIILRSDGASQNGGRTSTRATTSTALGSSIGSRGNFDNDIDFPALTPNRPGLAANRFPAPATSRPPAKSPGACVWAIVQCCPANNRLTTCFESMGCPGVNWDPSPCRGSLADAARAEIVRFYEAA